MRLARLGGPAGVCIAEELISAVFTRSATMAIKYGRPIEARLAPVAAKIKRKPGLDLAKRPRRNRKAQWARRLVREHALTTHDLIWPLFLTEGSKTRVPVDSMPGVERLSVDEAVRETERAAELAIPCLALFPYTDPKRRDQDGSEALNPDNLVCRAIRAIKQTVPEVGVLCDVALDPYTSHGHDGLLRDGVILNDETVEVLVQQALVEAEAGCDIIAPSDMMDGRVAAIRAGLDRAGFTDVSIMAYAAKYASAFYGPFRDAVGSAATLIGDKRTYQMDPANSDEALREVELDISEGADDSDADVRDEAVAGAFDDLSGKPSRDQADQQNDENRFIRHAYFLPFGDAAHRGRRPQSIQHTERAASRPAIAARRPHDASSWWSSLRGGDGDAVVACGSRVE